MTPPALFNTHTLSLSTLSKPAPFSPPSQHTHTQHTMQRPSPDTSAATPPGGATPPRGGAAAPASPPPSSPAPGSPAHNLLTNPLRAVKEALGMGKVRQRAGGEGVREGDARLVGARPEAAHKPPHPTPPPSKPTAPPPLRRRVPL